MNYCTGWFSRLGCLSWNHCCRQHDDHAGAVDLLEYDREFFRLMADAELRSCVNKVLPVMGDVMFLGVRVFGPIYRWIKNGKTYALARR